VGASSISRLPQGYTQNAPSTAAHSAAIRDGGFSTVRGHALSRDDRLRARIIEAIMCDFRVDAEELMHAFGIARPALLKLLREAVDPFTEFVSVTEDGLCILPEGRPLARIIARAFDAYELSKAGHSPAI
jgi:oxygen-independent coproporphyrinogen-3 oxidase